MSTSSEFDNPDLTDEELVRLYEPILKKAQQDPRRFRGLVAASEGRRSRRTGLLPWQKSAVLGPFGQEQINPRKTKAKFPKPEPIVKRVPYARTESMARRLWDEVKIHPERMPILLKYLHETAWKEGLPVTFEQCQEAATELLEKAERKAQLKRR